MCSVVCSVILESSVVKLVQTLVDTQSNHVPKEAVGEGFAVRVVKFTNVPQVEDVVTVNLSFKSPTASPYSFNT